MASKIENPGGESPEVWLEQADKLDKAANILEKCLEEGKFAPSPKQPK